MVLLGLAWMALGALTTWPEGIPEPPLILYGTVTNKTPPGTVRLASGVLTWRFVPSDGSSPVLASTRLTNINNQFSYRLMVPCESQIATLLISSNTLKLAQPAISYDRSQVTVEGISASLTQPTPSTFVLTRSGPDRVLRIDLEVALPALDSDGNGLVDEWEIRYFGHLGVAPNADPDQDGMSNLAEMKAGTDPNNSQSFFAFTEILSLPPGAVRIGWSSVAGKVYTLQRSMQILTGFTDLKTGILATPPLNLYTDSSASGGSSFYLVRTQE